MNKLPVALLDFFAGLLCGIIVLFIISTLLISQKKDAVEAPKPRSEFILTVEWDQPIADIDTWMKRTASSAESKCGFNCRETAPMLLHNDHTSSQYGVVEEVPMTTASEVLEIIGKHEGLYEASLHAFALRGEEVTARVTLIKTNPYKVLLKKTIEIDSNKQEYLTFSLELNEEGEVLSLVSDPDNLFPILSGEN